MIISDVELLNFDLLYNMIVEKGENDNYRFKSFGNHMSDIFYQMKVRMTITQLNIMEYIHLKRFAYKITEFIPNEHMDSDVLVSDAPDSNFGTSVKALTEFLKITVVEDERELHPYLFAGLLQGSCTVILSGPSVNALVQTTPERFFMSGSNRRCILNMEKSARGLDIYHYDPDYSPDNDEAFETYVIKTFIEVFYKFIMDENQSIDLITDSLLHSLVLSNATNQGDVALYMVENKNFTVNFLKEDSEIIKDISKIKVKELTDDTEYTFILNSSFYTFCVLYNFLPKSSYVFTESFDFLRQNIDKEYKFLQEVPWFAPYKKRLSKMFNAVIEESETFKAGAKYLLYLFMLPTQNTFSYVLKFTEKELKHAICKIFYLSENVLPETSSLFFSINDKLHLVAKMLGKES